MDDQERRQALAKFLRTRRARFSPPRWACPRAGVAARQGCGAKKSPNWRNIGVSWYTLLEQGQDVHPSRQVLESLAEALRLGPAETRHLFLLASQDAPAKLPDDVQVPPALQRVVEALSPHPAFVIGRRWDVLFWNRPAEFLFRFDEPCPPHGYNVLWRFFMHGGRNIDLDWEIKARNLVAQFRADYARYPGDASFQQVISDLQRVSVEFRLWWEQQDVRGLPDGERRMQHPTLGLLEFEHASFQTSLTSDLHVKVYVASPATAARLAEALAAKAL